MKPEMKSLIQIYQKNRNEKKPLKMVFDELGFYTNFLKKKSPLEVFQN